MTTEIRILVLVIVCSQFLGFSYSYSFCLKMQLILVTVIVIVLVTVMMCVLRVRMLYHHYYAHAYTVYNACSLHQSECDYTIPTYWEQFQNANMVFLHSQHLWQIFDYSFSEGRHSHF